MPCRRRKQLDPPVDRRAHRLLSARGVTRAVAQDREACVEHVEQLSGREPAQPGRGKLDRERNPVETSAKRCNELVMPVEHRPGSSDTAEEQLLRRRRLEGANVEDVLTGKAKATPARDEQRQPWGCIEESRKNGRA